MSLAEELAEKYGFLGDAEIELIRDMLEEAIERCAQKADHFASESGYATEIAKDIRALKSK